MSPQQTAHYQILHLIETKSEISQRDLAKVLISQREDMIELSYSAWQLLHPAMRCNVLRLAISEIGTLLDITSLQLEEVSEMLEKGVGRKFKILSHSLRIELKDAKIVIRR